MNIVQKKGDPQRMHGKLTAYARVYSDHSVYPDEQSPINAMIETGWLVAQGNYRDQNSLKDFLMQELGTSLDDEEGIRQFVEGLDGLEGALDPEKFRERINHLEEMQEFIPTPAKMVMFRSEPDILEQEGDIFYLGEYTNPANANLAVNAATILYQAQYRETQIHKLRSEIDEMIYGSASEQIENRPEPKSDAVEEIEKITETVERQLMRRFIPELLLAVERGDRREQAETDLREFLDLYMHKADIDRLIELTETNRLTMEKNRLIMLYCQKIDAVLSEQFDLLPEIVREIGQIEQMLRESSSL